MCFIWKIKLSNWNNYQFHVAPSEARNANCLTALGYTFFFQKCQHKIWNNYLLPWRVLNLVEYRKRSEANLAAARLLIVFHPTVPWTLNLGYCFLWWGENREPSEDTSEQGKQQLRYDAKSVGGIKRGTNGNSPSMHLFSGRFMWSVITLGKIFSWDNITLS